MTSQLRSLSLTNFRNLRQASLAAHPQFTILHGANGSGKTNILEALSLLAPGRGFRQGNCDVWRNQATPSDAWAIIAEVDSSLGTTKLATGALAGQDKRQVRIDEVNQSQQTLMEYLSIWYLVPAQYHIFLEGTSARRDYLDQIVRLFFSEHARHQAVFDHAKSERMALLQQRSRDTLWLATLEQRMAEHALAIAAARLEVIDAVNAAMQHVHPDFPRALLSLSGMLEEMLHNTSALEVEQRYAETLAAERESDGQQGRTQSGPHRSHMLVHYTAKQQPAELCSTGEQKALLLSITLATAIAKKRRSGQLPLLLLDEVVAHLDPARRAALVEALSALEAQCWLTGTEPAFFDAFLPHSVCFKIEDGRVIV